MRNWPLLRRGCGPGRTPVTVMWVPPASKAETWLTLRGCPLPRRFRPVPVRRRLCPPSTRGLTLLLGSGSGLVSSSVPWDEFVPGLWEYVQLANEEEEV